MAGEASCPFCGIRHSEYMIQLHIETYHGETSSTSSDDSVPSSSNVASSCSSVVSPATVDSRTRCTRPGCGQYVNLSQIDGHLALHESLRHKVRSEGRPRAASRAPDSPAKLQVHSPSLLRDPRSIGLLRYFSGSSSYGTSSSSSSRPSSLNSRVPPRVKMLRQPQKPGRLGKRELGPYAFEEAMPDHVRRHLINDAQPRTVNQIRSDGRLEQRIIIPNETPGLIPILADLCNIEQNTATTYLCDPSVRHIHKIQCDGNFCGYWNIQVLLTYLRRHHPGLRGMNYLPDVLLIQDTIERAWENGICIYGGVETGGIRGSRKWIGTHEALAYFTQMGIRVEALSFREDEHDGGGDLAGVALLDHVEAYFMGGLETARRQGSSHVTGLPPIYLQRFGHSMSIVGLERLKDGHRNLLVFDSSFSTSNAVDRLLDGKRAQAAPGALLKPYRRSDDSLARWEEFEIIV